MPAGSLWAVLPVAWPEARSQDAKCEDFERLVYRVGRFSKEGAGRALRLILINVREIQLFFL